LTLARNVLGTAADVFDDRVMHGVALRRPDLSGLINGEPAARNQAVSGRPGEAVPDLGDVLAPLGVGEWADPVRRAGIRAAARFAGRRTSRVGGGADVRSLALIIGVSLA
jgi:hypothetical protein